jgi:hypothetical protein
VCRVDWFDYLAGQVSVDSTGHLAFKADPRLDRNDVLQSLPLATAFSWAAIPVVESAMRCSYSLYFLFLNREAGFALENYDRLNRPA